MTTKNFLGVTALIAATSLAPSAFATRIVSGTITVLDLTVDGQCATKTVNLAGDAVTQIASCSGQVRKTIVGSGASAIVTTASYDAAGRLLSRRDATGAGTDYTYDSLGRKLTETDAAIAGKVRRYAYDAVGHLVASTDPLGITTTYSYDARDRKVADSTPMNANEVRTIRYGFDGRGNMTTLTDANGAVTTWGFDSVGRQVSKAYANGDTRAMAYDVAGRLVKLTDENGKDTVSVFDLAGRLLTKAFADGTQDTYAYDAASRMTSVTKGRYNHKLAYGYDAAGRVATETHPDGTVLHLAYDAANRLANLSLNDGTAYAVAYAFNGNGQLSTVSSGDYATRYEYRSNGQLASTIDYRVIDPQADILRADRAYDAGARLTEVANTAANGEQVGVRYTLSSDDQRVEALEETGQKWQYGYDGLKQLVSAKKTDTSISVVPPLDQSFSYDPMGNRRAYTEQGKSVAYTANSANQYTGISETASNSAPSTSNCAYDRNGNMLTDGKSNYTWDAENQLTSVTPVNPAEGLQRVEYTYDWKMRRKDKKSFTFTAGNWVLTKTSGFKYHEWNPIEETTVAAAGSTEKKNYIWGNDLSRNLHGAGGVGGLLSMKYNSDSYFYAYDGNGNVRALVKADAANPAASGVVERYAYDGFGRQLEGVGLAPRTSDRNAFRFSTKQSDAETGMNYYGYRYYAADAGRWVNRDRIAERGGLNVYGMVGNCLMTRVDFLGLICRPTMGFGPEYTPWRVFDARPVPNQFQGTSSYESNDFYVDIRQTMTVSCLCCDNKGRYIKSVSTEIKKVGVRMHADIPAIVTHRPDGNGEDLSDVLYQAGQYWPSNPQPANGDGLGLSPSAACNSIEGTIIMGPISNF